MNVPRLVRAAGIAAAAAVLAACGAQDRPPEVVRPVQLTQVAQGGGVRGR